MIPPQKAMASLLRLVLLLTIIIPPSSPSSPFPSAAELAEITETARSSLTRLGSNYGGWMIWLPQLSARSIIYSFGVGTDISFDLQLIRRFDVEVNAFDATPISREWFQKSMASGKFPPLLIERFHFHPYLLGAEDGNLTLNRPHGHTTSFAPDTLQPPDGFWEEAVTLPARRLRTLMAMLNHSVIDVLKVDIEGGEFSVFAQTVRDHLALASSRSAQKARRPRPRGRIKRRDGQRQQEQEREDVVGGEEEEEGTGPRLLPAVRYLPVCQLLVEFHPHLTGPKASHSATAEALQNLASLGFELLHYVHENDGARNALLLNPRFCHSTAPDGLQRGDK